MSAPELEGPVAAWLEFVEEAGYKAAFSVKKIRSSER